MTWELSLTGLLIGLLVGVTGMGGGSLMTPILVLVFDFNVVLAVGTDILHGAIFKTIGALRHRVLGHVHARLTFWLALGSVPSSLLGVYVVELLKDTYGEDVNDVAARILGIALVLGAVGLFARTFLHRAPVDLPYHLTNRDRLAAVLVGVFGGFVLGLTSVGSGTFFGLALLVLFPTFTAAKIVGTDIFHAAVLLWAAGFAHLSAGNVDLSATAWLAVGSIPGVLIGSQLTVRLPERAIRFALATVLLLAGIKLADVIPGF